jgi:hypothetical protein
MQIFVHTTNSLPLSSAHRERVSALIADGLAAIEHNVMSVNVFVSDQNNDKGGLDVVCRMVAEVPAGPAIVCADIPGDLDLAARAATDMLVAQSRRYWERRNARERRSDGGLVPPPPPDAVDAEEILRSL